MMHHTYREYAAMSKGQAYAFQRAFDLVLERGSDFKLLEGAILAAYDEGHRAGYAAGVDAHRRQQASAKVNHPR